MPPHCADFRTNSASQSLSTENGSSIDYLQNVEAQYTAPIVLTHFSQLLKLKIKIQISGRSFEGTSTPIRPLHIPREEAKEFATTLFLQIHRTQGARLEELEIRFIRYHISDGSPGSQFPIWVRRDGHIEEMGTEVKFSVEFHKDWDLSNDPSAQNPPGITGINETPKNSDHL